MAQLGSSTRFFFYGTLLDADLRRHVIGRDLAATELVAASVSGFRRVRVEGQGYPMLVAGAATDRVDGVIASGLDAREIAALVAYEGVGYGLQPIATRLADGTSCEAQIFRPISGGGHKPSDEAWDLARWQREHKAGVLSRPAV